MGATLFAQTNLSGNVVDENNTPLPGADIIVIGTTQGTSSDFDGNFTFDTDKASGTISVGFMGYTTKKIAFNGKTNFGTVQLAASSESLDEVVIVGVADIAKDRETPVAVSTIKASEIIERLGSKEFPEILNTTPSVYATKQGGGFGDSRINIRGFDQRNTAVMINGMPVNDMENGWVYWSNWAGLSDVTSAMQVQRGLGSSKLAISSVGGTINILTKASDKKAGGTVSFSAGNDMYQKYMASYSTGLMDSGFSTSVLFSRTTGDGYVDGTQFEGYNYFLAFGYKLNENNDVQLTITGAPQWHHQRSYAPVLGDYLKYSSRNSTNTNPDTKYNSDWGYLDGEEFSWRRNFYHKPIASLNWDFNISDVSSISSVLYASVGRGGGTGEIGRINGGKQYYGQFKTEDGIVRNDDIYSWNTGGTVPDFANPNYGQPEMRSTFNNGFFNTGSDGHPDGEGKYGSDNGITRRASMNSHNWYGLIANFNTELNENLSFDFGIDARSYKGIHYRRIENLMGADGYIDYDNINNENVYDEDGNPISIVSDVTHSGGALITETYPADFSSMINVFGSVDDEQKIDYYNEGLVKWYGAFTQLEYKNDVISAFVQGGVSQQGFQRIDYFNYLDSDSEQTSDWQNLLGGNVKGGLNWNVNENHNFFVNAGYYSKQPNFDAVFPNYNDNDVNDGLINETIIGTEIGYGFRAQNYRLDINLYRTSWADRFSRTSSNFDLTPLITDDDDVRGTANLEGITQIHQGIEIEGSMKFNKLKVNIMGAFGDYQYASDVTATFFDENENPIILPGDTEAKEHTLYLDGKKVGDVAQITARFGLQYDFLDNLSFDISQFYADKLYASINAEAFADEEQRALRLSAYSLLDAGLSYKLKFNKNKNSLKFRLNVNNLANHVYISEADTNITIKNQSNFMNEDGTPDTGAYEGYLGGLKTYKGVDQENRVFFGYGRTWNASVRFNF